MRNALFALLVAVPTSLITWIVARGAYDVPQKECAPVAQTTESGTSPSAAVPDSEPDPDERLSGFIEKPIEGFSVNGEVTLYGRNGLFEYINGGAPLYIDRNFRKLAVAEMKTTSGSELTCDIYDMRTAEDAKSIYDAEGSAKAKVAEFGDAGRTGSFSLVFRKNQFYVKLTAYDAKAEAALPDLARALLERMK